MSNPTTCGPARRNFRACDTLPAILRATRILLTISIRILREDLPCLSALQHRFFCVPKGAGQIVTVCPPLACLGWNPLRPECLALAHAFPHLAWFGFSQSAIEVAGSRMSKMAPITTNSSTVDIHLAAHAVRSSAPSPATLHSEACNGRLSRTVPSFSRSLLLRPVSSPPSFVWPARLRLRLRLFGRGPFRLPFPIAGERI